MVEKKGMRYTGYRAAEPGYVQEVGLREEVCGYTQGPQRRGLKVRAGKRIITVEAIL